MPSPTKDRLTFLCNVNRNVLIELLWTTMPAIVFLGFNWIAIQHEVKGTSALDALESVIGLGELSVYVMALVGNIIYIVLNERSLPFKNLIMAFSFIAFAFSLPIPLFLKQGHLAQDGFLVSLTLLIFTFVAWYFCKFTEHKASMSPDAPTLKQNEDRVFRENFNDYRGVEK